MRIKEVQAEQTERLNLYRRSFVPMCRSAGVAAARAAVMMMMGAEPGGEAVAPAEPPEGMHMHTPVSALPGLTVRTREPAAEEEVEHTVGG